MDPLSALGLAAAVIQFINFATEKCRNVQQLYETGERSLIQAIAFERTAKDFINFSTLLRNRERFGGQHGHLSNENDKAIDTLVDDCSAIARELSDIFKKLTEIRKRGDVVSKVISLMRGAWKYDEITHLSEQMRTYQNQLVLRLLHYLNTNTEAANKIHGQRFDVLQQNYSRIIEVLAISEDKLDLLAQQGTSLRHQIDATDAGRASRQEKTLAAVVTLQNGESKFLTASTASDQAAVESGTQTLLTLRAESESAAGSANIKNFKPIQHMVLGCLYFRHHRDRIESVKSAHRTTYDWVFHQHKRANVPWDPFIEWLETGHGCYWINGKAGSGKSTLMKFILEDDRTKHALDRWARDSGHELASASFFFWNLGSKMQKSQHGLLRSLLFDVLQERPHLISVVMPELWFAGATVSDDRMLAEPSYMELLRWFRRLLEQTKSQLRLFFLIDGIDEFEGDYFDLMSLITSQNENENIKFLVSSRPIPVCFDAFKPFAGLRLQDLTQDDIRRYAVDHLKHRLEARHGDEWEPITDQIVKKSCGVFLWVVLVVKSLLTGLQNWDVLAELRDRLDEFPSDLKDLYAAMFKQLPQLYRQQASELFQISLLAMQVQEDGHQVTPLQLHFAHSDDATLLQTPIEPLTIEEEKNLCDAIEGRIRARCAGILEVQSINFRMDGFLSSSVIKHFVVGFIHRTAVEFLRLPEVWNDLLGLTRGTAFHPAVNLCRSCILLCKTTEHEPVIKLEHSMLWFYMDKAMRYASISETHKHAVLSNYLQELDRSLSQKWKASSFCSFGSRSRSTKNTHWTSAYTLAIDNEVVSYDQQHPGQLLAPATKPLSFHSLAVFHCLSDFLADNPADAESQLKVEDNLAKKVYDFLASDPENAPSQSSVPTSQATRLLFDATRNLLFDRPWAELHPMLLRAASVCSLLLSQGADPNAKVNAENHSSWDLMLQYTISQLDQRSVFWKRFGEEGLAYHFSKLLVVFVRHNADVNASVFRHSMHYDIAGSKDRVAYSALKAINSLLSKDANNSNELGPPELMFCARGNPEPPNQELKDLHGFLRDLMLRKGAVDAVYNETPIAIPSNALNTTPTRGMRMSDRVRRSIGDWKNAFAVKH
ncbi:hypothetical protein EDB80DRAFT_176381 [Ilyonectria destructans]|nr:hypothetical protein EDB80DRAFT_176381 [Ilyonectria destructans]